MFIFPVIVICLLFCGCLRTQLGGVAAINSENVPGVWEGVDESERYYLFAFMQDGKVYCTRTLWGDHEMLVCTGQWTKVTGTIRLCFSDPYDHWCFGSAHLVKQEHRPVEMFISFGYMDANWDVYLARATRANDHDRLQGRQLTRMAAGLSYIAGHDAARSPYSAITE